MAQGRAQNDQMHKSRNCCIVATKLTLTAYKCFQKLASVAVWAMQEIPLTKSESLTFEYVPRPGLLKIALINFFLGLITLTIYRFWAKTNTRKHVWSCIHINGEPLEYTGTGVELFKGFLLVFGLFILPCILILLGLQLYFGEAHPIVLSFNLLFALTIYFMWGFAVYKQRKYQLSRTQWRGIRGTLVGSAMIYSLTFFGSILAKSFSFGWATPVMNTVLQEQITNDTRFGDAAFKFKGNAGPLYPTYALCWFLTFAVVIGAAVFFSYQAATWAGAELGSLFDYFNGQNTDTQPTERQAYLIGTITLFIIAAMLSIFIIIPMLWAVYTAKEIRTFASYTRFDGAEFKLNARPLSMIWLTISNILLFLFTLGIARPYIIQRSMRYLIDRLTLQGAIDIARIQQSTAEKPSRGEGLADAFDVGAW